MHVAGDLGFRSLVLVVCFLASVIGFFVVRRKWRLANARREEIRRLLVLAKEEVARAEFEVTAGYGAVPVAEIKGSYCVVCYCPTTTRCARCKSVRYCSAKCQIVHWRQGHKEECRPPSIIHQNVVVASDSELKVTKEDLEINTDKFESRESVEKSSEEPALPNPGCPPDVECIRDDDSEDEFLAERKGTNSTSDSPATSFSGFSTSASGTESSDDVSVSGSVSSFEPDRSDGQPSADDAFEIQQAPFNGNNIDQSKPSSPKFASLVDSVGGFAKLNKLNQVKLSVNDENERRSNSSSGLNNSGMSEGPVAESCTPSSDFWGNTLDPVGSRSDAQVSNSRVASNRKISDSGSSLHFSFNLSGSTAPPLHRLGSRSSGTRLGDDLLDSSELSKSTCGADLSEKISGDAVKVKNSPSQKSKGSKNEDNESSSNSHAFKFREIKSSSSPSVHKSVGTERISKCTHALKPSRVLSTSSERSDQAVKNCNRTSDVLKSREAGTPSPSVSVFVNYGTLDDYLTLEKMGVNVSGKIVLAKYGSIYRGSIVQIAYEAGAVGVLVYTDRKDYGGGGGAKWFPDEKWLPPSGVQVGSVYNAYGDPTTPGWASSEECERLSDEEVEEAGDVGKIPSLPISAADGETILRAIGGKVANDDWQGSDDAPVYRVGPGPGVVHLSYTGKQVIGRIENVIGVIEGEEEPDRFVILGNHRDAWTFGAVDPNSGTAALLEIAQRLGKLQKRGWKPRRTIVLCNWDAEEYGLIGSTEWVEENRHMLASKAIAYLNVDSAVYGPGFWAASTPQLDELLKQATQQVKDPDNSSQTLYQSWVGSSSLPMIGRLGSGESDFAAFVHHIGIPAADMAFGKGYPVYHSMYDDFIWMQRFGDPLFQRHVAVASLWGLVALWLADAEVLPFNYLSYALELQSYVKDLEDELSGKNVNLTPLFKSIEELEKAAANINSQREEIEQCKTNLFTRKKDHLKVRELNDRLMMVERTFTDQDGLLGRSWFKHLIYGPSKHDDYGSVSFPGIGEAIEKAKSLETAESWKIVQHEVYRVSRAVKHASQIINGELT